MSDPINPDHYRQFPVEVIDLTEHLSFNRGNAVKYIARAIALTDDYDGCFERIDEWEALEHWERDAHPSEEPVSEREDAEFWLRRADAVLALLRR